MANIPVANKPNPITIDKFLGLNSAETSETQLALGEASEMKNIRVVEGYKIESVDGYENTLETEQDVISLFQCKVKDEEMLIYQLGNGDIYKRVNDVDTKINGEFVASKATFIGFEDKLYILDGNEYYEYDGTTFKIVEGYVPLVAIGTEPSGGGTDFEGINLLSNKRHQTFSPDGTAKEFVIRETKVASIDKVLVNGEEATGVTKDVENGKVTFTTAPTKAVDNIDIYWTVSDEESRKLVTRNKYMMLYGSSNDTRIFIYGDSENKNRFRYSDLGNGELRGDYFPANNFKDEGASNYAITGLVKHYDRLVVLKENELRYAEYSDLTTTNTTGDTVTIPSLASYPLNATVGNIPMAQVGVLDNYPIAIGNKGMYQIVQSNVRAESNVQYISQRVQNILDEMDLTKVITYDYETKHEYWIIEDKKVLVYNYELNVFYKFEFSDNVLSIVEYNKKLYFGTNKGLMKFDSEVQTFNGQTIESEWIMGYYNFGHEIKRKMLTRLYVSCQPYLNSNIDIEIETDRGLNSQQYAIDVLMANFFDVNFNRFSFDTIYNPKPRRIKAKAKKFVYLRLKIKNKEWKTKFKILSIAMQWSLGGETK